VTTKRSRGSGRSPERSIEACALALLASCAAGGGSSGDVAPQAAIPAPDPRPIEAPPAAVPAVATSAILERPVVIGASLSAGFGLYHEVGEVVTLADVVDAALAAPHGPVQGFGNGFFFQAPLERGHEQIERARSQDPTLVVALDFLFWFGYGMPLTEPERLALLERGLELLGAVECPLLVGDFPDMRAALESDFEILGQRMIYPAQVPAPATLALLNARLRAWAAERANVVVAPLAEFAALTNAGAELEFRGRTLAGGRAAFLQRDLLHPNLAGACATALLALDALAQACAGGALDQRAVDWDFEALRERIWEAAAPARAEREAKARAREERKRAAAASDR
jgi:hypothetical protein